MTGKNVNRDLRVDFARGLALWWISIGHVNGNILVYVTLKKYCLADAAEVFVLLAGYTAGLVYSRLLVERGWYQAAGAVLRRAAVVYTAHILMIFFSIGLLGYISTNYTLSKSLIESWRLEPFVDAPLQAIGEVAMLRYQPKFMDILPLYVVALSLFAAALPLLSRPRVLLGASFLLYFCVQFFALEPQGWPDAAWTFNPFAWQLLFMTGAILGNGLYGPTRPRVPFSRWLVLACVLFLMISKPLQILYYHQYLMANHTPDWFILVVNRIGPLMPSDEAKRWLHPLRVAAILAVSYTARFVIMRDARWLQDRIAAPFVLMGQHGLAVFCATTPLAAVATLSFQYSPNWPMQIVVNVAVIAMLVIVAVVAKWLKPGKQSLLISGNGVTFANRSEMNASKQAESAAIVARYKAIQGTVD